MGPLEFLLEFRTREAENDVLKANWYTVAAAGLAAAGMGEHMPELYCLATIGLPLDARKIVQRRIKEAILKGAVLYGIPRSGQALGPLFRSLPDNEIDLYAPRTEQMGTAGENERRVERGRKYFDTLWTPGPAQAVRDRILKYHPDHYLLNVKTIYEFWISEDTILSNVETQMCNTALLTCWNSPEQAMWHTRGVVRHGGTLEQARFAQDLGLAISQKFSCKTGDIIKVEDIEF